MVLEETLENPMDCRKTNLSILRWLDSVLEATGMSLAKLREAVEDRGAWRALVHGVTTEQQTSPLPGEVPDLAQERERDMQKLDL